MNMKKLFGIIVLAMLAVCSTALVSCGDDDEEEAILGTWRNTYEYQGRTTGYWQYTFAPNGVFVAIEVSNSSSWQGSGSYKVKGNKLIIFFTSDGSDGGTYTFTFNISGKTLTLTDSEGETEVFTRQ